jgi:enamidase
VIGGALILEKGLTREDFEEMAREGVRVVGEIGLGSVKDPEDAAPMVKWAKELGMTVMMHTGGTSIPGSSTVTAEQVIRTDPHIASHINGGPTAVALDEVKQLVNETDLDSGDRPLRQSENGRGCRQPLCAAAGALDRVIIGNDAPSGTGVIPSGHSSGHQPPGQSDSVKPEEAVCMATGNTARIYNLNRGVIAPGKEADLVILDAPMGSVGDDALSAISAGDVPGVAMVLVDGQVVVGKSRNTPPPKRKGRFCIFFKGKE